MVLLTRTGLRINRYCSMFDFPFYRSSSEADYASSCQISPRSVKAFRRYGRFWISKMAAVRHLGFLKVGNFNFRSGSKAQYTSSCQILRRSLGPFRRYGRFSIFKMAAVRHLGFSKVGIFNCPYPSEGQNASSCQISRR